MNTHETYVNLETAKLLKEAGFDWEVYSLYQCYPEEDSRFSLDSLALNYNICSNVISAPTLDVAQRWLREVKGVEVYAHVFYDSYDTSDGWDVYVYEVNHITKQIEDWIKSYDVYYSYEEAQEAGIKKCLTFLLNEDK